MWPFENRSRYFAVPIDDASMSTYDTRSEKPMPSSSRDQTRFYSFLIWLVGLSCLAIGFSLGEVLQDNGLLAQLKVLGTSGCAQPVTRREWRQLALFEKEDYVRAVKCLLGKPSKIRSEGFLYDDFPYVHNTVGRYAHNAAPFLSWHRYYIHTYERELKESCGYAGNLPYWDWTLDWENLSASPVFSNITGFGGNGDLTAPKSVGGGTCVTDGPFADITLAFSSNASLSHCLSRDFYDDVQKGRLSGNKVRPSKVEQVLEESTFKTFFLTLEKGPHNEIPNTIGGDFLTFTAPNDPLFFLHHCGTNQLDRLWWKWQQAERWTRESEYSGPARHGSSEKASISDVLPMGGLAPDIVVGEIMRTEAEVLCYRY